MSKYFFILGNNPTLSAAEIIALLQPNQDQLIMTDGFLIADLAEEIDVSELLAKLGGSIKLGKIESEQNLNAFSFNPKKQLANLTISPEQKFYFGFSIYGALTSELVRVFNKIGMQVKKELASRQVKARWVTSQEQVLSSVIVEKNKLVSDQGVEWCIFKNKNKIFIGRTLAVQEFEDYGRRDFGRPARDARSGMLPPKLAKIMINLAKDNLPVSEVSLLDPFCGSGTVLQEAMLLGIKKLRGSDFSDKAVADALVNLEWLEKNFSQQADWQVEQQDARSLSKIFPVKSFDLIVSELFLGPPLTGNESFDYLEKNMKDLSELYLAALTEFKKVLKNNGRLCLAWPVFIFDQQRYFLSIYEEIKKLGFIPINLFTDNFINTHSLFLSDRGTIVYGRPEQKVHREIVLLSLGSDEK